MDPINVTAQFDTDGQITPLRFTWKGREYRVESTGRRWEAADGQHILVMIPSERIFELVFALPAGRWYLNETFSAGMVA